jgi:Helix-turn-helix domain
VQRLHTIDLARRWKYSPRTLENLRWRKKGPPYLKLNGRVIYRLEDIEAYEAQHLRNGPLPPESAASAQQIEPVTRRGRE